MIARLPIIRHIRWLYLSWCVERHYRNWAALGLLPFKRHLDDAYLDRIWRGEA